MKITSIDLSNIVTKKKVKHSCLTSPLVKEFVETVRRLLPQIQGMKENTENTDKIIKKIYEAIRPYMMFPGNDVDCFKSLDDKIRTALKKMEK